LTSLYRWKASQQAGAEGALSDLTLKDKHGEVIEKQLPGGKVKKKAKNEIILETNTRSRKKCVTTILGALLSCVMHLQITILQITKKGPCQARHGVLQALQVLQCCVGAYLWSAAGLETFGIKLPEAAKLFGKKFASGASITKNPMEKDQIEVSCHGHVVLGIV
jgi:translation initiation factor 1 (eIF-1/SUI1)